MDNTEPTLFKKFQDGNPIITASDKNVPNGLQSRGIVRSTKYDKEKNCNICLILLFAEQDFYGNWKGLEKDKAVLRPEWMVEFDSKVTPPHNKTMSSLL